MFHYFLRPRRFKYIFTFLGASLLLTIYHINQIPRPHYPDAKAYRSGDMDYSHFFLAPDKNKTIQICVMAGYEGAEIELEVFLKSVILNAHLYSITIHIICGDGSRPLIDKLIHDLHHPYINMKFELYDLDKKYIFRELDKIRVAITYHAGIYGVAKAYLHRLMPSLEKCILLDTDLIFGSDPAFLWEEFENQEKREVITMKINAQTNTQFLTNSGVMLMNLKMMREVNFEENYFLSTEKYCRLMAVAEGYRDCALGDQTLFYGVFQDYPYFFHSLPGSWILEFCYGFLGYSFEAQYSRKQNLFFGIAHLNCVTRKENMAFHAYLEGQGPYYYTNLQAYIRNLMDLDLH